MNMSEQPPGSPEADMPSLFGVSIIVIVRNGHYRASFPESSAFPNSGPRRLTPVCEGRR